MALLTDGPISTLSDLQALDSAVFETSKIENVDLSAKTSVAAEEVRLELAAFLLRTEPGSIQTGSSGGYDLSHVVVTSGLRRWHCLRSLANLYCDIYNNQLNDRYLGKWKHYVQLARETWELYTELGVGIVSNPIPMSEKPTVSPAGTGGLVGTYVMQTAWRSLTGEAGSPSEPVAFPAPSGEIPALQANNPPAIATGFDVFAGLSGQPPTRQNSTPLAIGTLWVLPPSGLVTGELPGDGQAPQYYVRRSRVI